MVKKEQKEYDYKDKTLENEKEKENVDKLDRKVTSDELEVEVGSVNSGQDEKHDKTNDSSQNNYKNEKENNDKNDNKHEHKDDNKEEKEEDEEDPQDQSNIYQNKDKGNKLFSEGDVDGAIKFWSKSINSLSYILNRSRTSNNEGVTMDTLNEYTNLYVTLCLNLSLAHLKKEEFDKCKQYCQYVLMYDDKNLKAHLRIVKADLKLNNYNQALSNCETGLKFNPDDTELLYLKKLILEQKKKYKQVEKGFYSKAFKKLEPDPRTEEDPMEKFQKSRLYKFNYKLLMFYYNVFTLLKKLWKLIVSSFYFLFDSIEYTVNFVVNSYNKIRSKLKRN